MEPDDFHKRATSYIKPPKDAEDGDNFEAKLDEFKKISTYVDGAYDEDAAFQGLEKHLAEIESKYDNKDPINRFFYVSLGTSSSRRVYIS